MITLNHYLVFSAIMFCIGLYGILRRKNILLLLFATEIMLNAVNVAFVAIGYYKGVLRGDVLAFCAFSFGASGRILGIGVV
ncbi:NADH-quinone oxidoreductase subunit NuoK, partial [Helicobacter fennelliae]|uniref:NADH-quinone oxidoreductase subunit NuoK n=1 Tax=Helicobacter fennelliae TaxID=215 RepID=UPI001B3433F9